MSAGEPTALFFACLVSGLLVPLPEDVALLVAGWQVQKGDIGAGAALLAGATGTLGRDFLAFLAGRIVGPRLERLPLVRRVIGEKRLARAHAMFEQRGRGMLFVTRFAVGLRAPLYFVGGSLGFPVGRFLTLDLLGLAITVPISLWLGSRFGEEAAEGLRMALAHQRLVMSLVLVCGVGWFVAQRGKRGE